MKLPPALLFSMLACLPFSVGDDPRLDAAKDAFKTPSEGSYTEGAQLAANVNTSDAADLLLEWLAYDKPRGGLSEGHFRDIVWTGLVQLTDMYAKLRVEAGLKTYRGEAWMREWCAELLGVYGDPDFAETLIKATRDKDEFVRAAATLSLGQLRLPAKSKPHQAAVKALVKATEDKHMPTRANAWIGLMRLAPLEHGPQYLQRIAGAECDPDGGARSALLLELPAVMPTAVEATASAALADPDWRVRLRAVQALSSIKSKAAIDALVIGANDARPTVARRAMNGLKELTGLAYGRGDSWAAWWQDKREGFAFPETTGEAQPEGEAEDKTAAAYNGLIVTSDHVAFVVDKSRAMREWLNHSATTKDEFAQIQLGEVLARLPKGVNFNVYTYQLEYEALNKKGPLEIDDKTIKKALKFTEGHELDGSKDIWKVLEGVISDGDIDTIYLLSSGEPDTGKYVHQNRIVPHVQNLNRFHGVTVNIVAYSERKFFRDQLEAIAVGTGGEFKWFE
jgi:hypothetical protein